MDRRIIELRKARKLTQAEFAEKLGFTQSNLSAIELGKIPLTEANIRLVCLTFGVNEEWLRNGTEAMLDEVAVLADQEKRIIEHFRQLTPTAKEEFAKLIKEKLELQELRKRLGRRAIKNRNKP